MLANRSGICIANSETGQLLQAGSHGTPQPGKGGRRAGNRDFQLSPAALLHLAITQTGVLYQSP
jgi:hypothetical protein